MHTVLILLFLLTETAPHLGTFTKGGLFMNFSNVAILTIILTRGSTAEDRGKALENRDHTQYFHTFWT